MFHVMTDNCDDMFYELIYMFHEVLTDSFDNINNHG